MSDPETRRWERRPEERPAQIVDAARAVFGARGLAGAHLDEIAERAGISKGTIYLYFDNKDALFRAVVEQTLGALESLARAERAGTAESRLRALARDVWTYLRTPDFQSVYRLVLGELHQFPELARFYSERVSGRVTNTLAAILEEGVSSGEFAPLDPAATARMLIALFLSHAVWCERRSLFPRLAGTTDEEIYGQVVDFYVRALRGGSPGAEDARERAGVRNEGEG